VRYTDVVGDLVRSYDAGAAYRDALAKDEWKLAERAAFADRVVSAGGGRLLEIGAGTGQDSVYFAERGLDVVATDLSPAMVERCRAKGLDARVMDFLNLDFLPGSFDAVFAFNCLLHVPDADLPAVLAVVRDVLRPGGLFFVGVYAGDGTEGIWEPDQHVPKRFFSWRTDEQLLAFAGAAFEVVDFHVVDLRDFRWQSLTLRA
jgi:SAM-dependent methyltransferase